MLFIVGGTIGMIGYVSDIRNSGHSGRRNVDAG